jgi:hypothetical protein
VRRGKLVVSLEVEKVERKVLQEGIRKSFGKDVE